MVDRVGQQFGNYRLVALLGTGGYAEVYLGQHLRLSLQAAIKVLHTHLTEQEAEHFSQEAETIAQLTHPTIVRILDYDVQDGVPFLVMDYAPGGSLRRRYPKGSLVLLPQIISSVKQVAVALQYAHEHKFIHRDVKPENMLVGRHEEVLLSDFGLAALSHSSASLSTQEAIGTLSYMAPEQIEGHPRAASDQYALGVVVYEWLCGQRPFEGSATEVMVQQLSMPPPLLHERISTISPELEQVVLRTLAKDPKGRFASVQAFAEALERASQLTPSPSVQLPSVPVTPGSAEATSYATVAAVSSQPVVPPEAIPSADLPTGTLEPTVLPPQNLITSQSQAKGGMPLLGHIVAPTAAVVPSPLEPTLPIQRKAKRLPRMSAALLIGLAVVILAGGLLGTVSLLSHFGMVGIHGSTNVPTVVRGGTWIDDFIPDPDSLIPNGSTLAYSAMIDQALYLPLFYGDAHGVIHPGAASGIPTVQNGGISPDVKTWTFHLRPHLVWSDDQPYDARDVDFTWRLWLNPKFGAANTLGLNLISKADVSADHLAITFHLTRPFAPFLTDLWVDGIGAPLPAHYFSAMAAEGILKSPDNLNPQVVSGPFMMEESLPADHYTLVHNPRYYRASEGLPYLDKVVFRIVANENTILKDLQAGSIDSAWFPDVGRLPQSPPLTHYTSTTPPTSSSFEALFFNFHNTVLASHPEVRQAIAMAIDHQALITEARHGFATPLCTNHGSFFHPGYDATAPCPIFDPAVANKLLNDNGWVRGPDGVRARDGLRLEFEYSTTVNQSWSVDGEAIIARNLQAIGIKLDIQNYPYQTFFGSFLLGGKASPSTGAVAGRYDIAELENLFGYDPDDSSILACNQIPPNGYNISFYCNSALDALYTQEQVTADPGLRQQAFIQIHKLYLTEFPFITLYSPTENWMVRKGTHNYSPSPTGTGETINIWEWWCDKGKC